MEMQQVLTPRVFWAQRHEDIYLRVELCDVTKVEVSLHDNRLQFRAEGRGAKGLNQYEFSLELLEPVYPEVLRGSAHGQVELQVRKQRPDWWSRLTLQEKKPLFLSPDFHRWLDQSDAEEQLTAREEERLSRVTVESRIRRDPSLSLLRVYLFMYNLVQFLGFSWIFVTLIVRLFILGQDSLSGTFLSCGDVMYFCQMMSLLEVVNPLLGLVNTPLLPPLLQVSGRNVVLFVVFGSLEAMQNRPVVFFVFFLWSAVDVIRYPYSMLRCVNSEWRLLTWLRFSLWIPLYPLGGAAEAVAVLQSLSLFDQSRLFSLPLPTRLGGSLSFSFTLHLYLILLFLGVFVNVRHLYKQRQRRYRSRRRKVQ